MNKKSKLNVLFLTFWTPPIIRPRAILIGKIIPEMMQQGIEPIIMTYDICGGWKINAPIHKIPDFKTGHGWRGSFLMRNLMEYLYYRRLFKVARKIIIDNDIEVVFSFSNPQASNILGAMLKKKLGIKFISHFSDPWYDNPYKSFSRLGAKKVKFLERFVIENSDRVVFTNDEAGELVMKKYPSQWKTKAITIPHCFKPAEYSEVKKNNQTGIFTFSHIGAFYKERNPDFLFEALNRILLKRPSANFKIKLVGCAGHYTGYSNDDLKDSINRFRLDKFIEIIPRVSYQESLELMKNSDCLIVIDANFVGSPFLPSKIVEYAGSGNLIIGITPSGSPTEKFLYNLGCSSFNYNQINGLTDYIEKLLENKSGQVINGEFLKNFEVKNIVRLWIEQFNKLING